MRITKNVARLIADLEPCIGSNCYNGSSYNGWTGKRGKHFRYPVTYRTTDGMLRKSKYSKEDLDLNYVEGMYYKTGTNEIYVGAGLIEVLCELEKRFNLDFDKLVEENL